MTLKFVIVQEMLQQIKILFSLHKSLISQLQLNSQKLREGSDEEQFQTSDYVWCRVALVCCSITTSSKLIYATYILMFHHLYPFPVAFSSLVLLVFYWNLVLCMFSINIIFVYYAFTLS